MFHLELRPEASKCLAALPREDQERIAAALRALPSEPRPLGKCKKMKGQWFGFWRVRIGRLRIVYAIDDAKKEITVALIDKRGDIY